MLTASWPFIVDTTTRPEEPFARSILTSLIVSSGNDWIPDLGRRSTPSRATMIRSEVRNIVEPIPRRTTMSSSSRPSGGGSRRSASSLGCGPPAARLGRSTSLSGDAAIGARRTPPPSCHARSTIVDARRAKFATAASPGQQARSLAACSTGQTVRDAARASTSTGVSSEPATRPGLRSDRGARLAEPPCRRRHRRCSGRWLRAPRHRP